VSRTEDPYHEPCEAWFLWSSVAPTKPLALLDAVAPLFDGLGERASRILAVTVTGGLERRRFTDKALIAIAARRDIAVVVMNREKDPPLEVKIFLRDGYFSPIQAEVGRFQRPVSVRAADRLRSRAPVMQFLARATTLYPVAHGAGMRPRDWNHASAHINLVSTGSRLVGDELKRSDFDAMNCREAHQKLRRLYPVTIIGPEIWAKLPPLPALDNPPIVTDLGNCKVLTAWPALCDPRDPAFLRGTEALRAWLWPHTIQNPADHVDEDPFEYSSS
jgi:hypothetical protein